MNGFVIVWLLVSLHSLVGGRAYGPHDKWSPSPIDNDAVRGEDETTTTIANVTVEPSELYLEHCINESKANRLAVIKLKSGDRSNANDALKKWALCYLAKQGVMSSAGVLSQDVVLKNIPSKDKDKVEKIIDKCLYKTAHDPVETAWHYINCFHRRGPKYAKKANRL